MTTGIKKIRLTEVRKEKQGYSLVFIFKLTSTFILAMVTKAFLLLPESRSCRVSRSQNHCSAGLCRWWPSPNYHETNKVDKSAFPSLQCSGKESIIQKVQIWIQILPNLQMEFRPCRMTPVNRVRWMASTSSHWCWSWYKAHQAPSYMSPSSMPDWKQENRGLTSCVIHYPDHRKGSLMLE